MARQTPSRFSRTWEFQKRRWSRMTPTLDCSLNVPICPGVPRKKKPAPHPYHPVIRAQVLERLSAGEFLKHFGREPGMPCPESVTGWMRADPAFAAEVAQARVRGEYRRRFMFDEAKAAALLARLRAGERIGDVLRDPAMPSRKTYRYWRMTYGAFAEQVHQVNLGKAEMKAARASARFRPYDTAIGERIYVRLWKGEKLRAILRSDKAFPSLAVLARWRRENPAFERMLQVALGGWRKKRPKGRHLLTEELQGRIIDGLARGGSLRSLAMEPGMPCQRTLYNWCRTRPEFAEAVTMACEDREDWCLAQAVEVAARGGWGARKKVAKLNAQRVRLRKRPGWKGRRKGA